MPITVPTTVTTVADNLDNDNNIDTVLIKVASRCNIDCSYCYVYNMGDDNWSRLPKFMDPSTVDGLCRNLAELASSQEAFFSVVLHGGEPFLLGKKKMESLLSQLRNVLSEDYPISIQTNGVLISEDLLDICSAYRTSVAVSLDGPQAVHDRLRVGHRGEGTFDSVMKGLRLLQNHADSRFLNAGLLAVIDPESDAGEVYAFFKSLNGPSVDFLYKDGNHDRLPEGKASIESVEYGEWMRQLLKVYLSDSQPIPIRVIDDMLKVLLGGTSSKEGMGLTDFSIIIIDTDGTVMKNDTLKSTFNGADKFSQALNIKEGSILGFLRSEEFLAYREMQRPSHSSCLNCPQLNLCGGGMILHRWSNQQGFNNPSVYCSDQIYFIDHMRNALKNLLEHVH